MAYNVPALGEEADFEAQMFSLAQMFIRMPNVQFSTEPAIFANCCWQKYSYFLKFIFIGFTNGGINMKSNLSNSILNSGFILIFSE